MNRGKKGFFGVMVLITILTLNHSVVSYAHDDSTVWERMNAEMKERVETFSGLFFNQTTPDYCQLISSPSGEVDYLYAEMNDGSIIIDLTHQVIAEASPSTKFFPDHSAQYAYNGGFEYYEMHDGIATDLTTGKTVSAEDVEDNEAMLISSEVSPTVSVGSGILSAPDLPAFVEIKATRYHIPMHASDRQLQYAYCAPIAVANYLLYMDNHYYNSNLVLSSHKTGDCYALVNAVIDIEETIHINDNLVVKYNGLSMAHMHEAIGVYSYLAGQNLSTTVSYSWNLSTYLNKINNNRPVLLGKNNMYDDGSGHVVTGIGFYISEYYTIDLVLYYDDDGIEKSINPGYFTQMLY